MTSKWERLDDRHYRNSKDRRVELMQPTDDPHYWIIIVRISKGVDQVVKTRGSKKQVSDWGKGLVRRMLGGAGSEYDNIIRHHMLMV